MFIGRHERIYIFQLKNVCDCRLFHKRCYQVSDPKREKRNSNVENVFCTPKLRRRRGGAQKFQKNPETAVARAV